MSSMSVTPPAEPDMYKITKENGDAMITSPSPSLSMAFMSDNVEVTSVRLWQ